MLLASGREGEGRGLLEASDSESDSEGSSEASEEVTEGRKIAFQRLHNATVMALCLVVAGYLQKMPRGRANLRFTDFISKGERLFTDLYIDGERLRLHTRFTPYQFDELFNLIGGKLKDGYHISARQKLMVFLHCVAQGRTFSGLQEEYHHSKATISKVFHEVLAACLGGYSTLVRPAEVSDAEAIYERTDSAKYWPWFEDAVGALDGSHIQAYISNEEPAPWRNRKRFLSQNVLAVVNHRRLFTYVLPGWEGSAHDGRVLAAAREMEGFNAPASPASGAGKYYLADAGYSNTDITLVPYRGVRYHLREVAAAGMKPQNAEELFNLRHSSLRNVVERTFGIFKERFQIFKAPPRYDIKTQTWLVYACAALHNLLTLTGGDQQDERELRPPLPEKDLDNHYDGSAEGAAVDKAMEAVTAMAKRRDEIAEVMWLQYKEEEHRRAEGSRKI